MVAYVIGQIDVHDPDTYKEYASAVPATLAQYGGRFCVRGGAVTPKEGDWNPARVVVLEFADMAAAHKWYDSPEYQAIISIRQKASEGKMIFVEGFEG
jgi:uncharacterized protein (DUF1330 family)